MIARPALTDRALSLLLTLCTLLMAACHRAPSGTFQVIPSTPAYLLQLPDAQQIPFTDILRAYNDFEPGRASVNLKPGMELRVENAYYREGMPKHGLDGFIGTETARYRMVTRGTLQPLSATSLPGRPNDQPPVDQLLPNPQRHRPQHRFYFAIVFRRTGNEQGSVLLNARSMAELNQMGAQLLVDPDAVCNPHSGNCTVFPAACSATLEIDVEVNRKSLTLPWGSLLSNVIAHPASLTLQRLYKGRLTRVDLNPADPEVLRLPLLPGDRLAWN